MEKKHYEFLVERAGCERYVDVYCTREELDIIASALVGYVHQCEDLPCCCVAKEGGDVSFGNYDFLFSDRM